MPRNATLAPGPSLLTPPDHTLILVDYQSQMAFATRATAGRGGCMPPTTRPSAVRWMSSSACTATCR